ncbi:polymer-forming cytoskeletal protein [Candidatus Uhrbacteria bacterium]|nr:polymer-forming cytoskeletal protein [Candidatus Uhrbacteria bacterium]
MALFSSPQVPDIKPILSADPKPEPSPSSSRPTATVIAKGVKVEGDFASDGDVQIEGEVKGSLATKGRLTVGVEAIIRAEVKAGDAIIAGTIEGNVIVERRIDLKSTAKLAGDLTSEALTVEAGAKVNGKVTVGQAKS